MIIEKKMYAIVGKQPFPLLFYSGGYSYSVLDESVLSNTVEDCEEELKTYDDAEDFQIVPVKITYEI